MAGVKTTAIIGAGISGLTTGKMLGDYGVPYTCFESSDRIGGNWAFGNPNGHSSAYRSLHIDTSKERLSFRDFPMPPAPQSVTARITRSSSRSSPTSSVRPTKLLNSSGRWAGSGLGIYIPVNQVRHVGRTHAPCTTVAPEAAEAD